MRAWIRGRRLLALFLSIIFVVGLLAAPAAAAGKSRSFSSGSSSGYKSSGSRSFSSSKSSSSSTPSRSFSSPPPSGSPSQSAPSPSKSSASPSYSSNAGGYSSANSPAYSSTTSPSYSSGSRAFSSDDWSFSSTRPSGSSSAPPGSGGTPGGPTVTEIPGSSYDPHTTKYPDMPPVIVTGPTDYGGSYWHEYYYGQPFYWRMFYRPVYHGSGFVFNWMALVGAFVVVWMLLGVLSAVRSRRRRRW